MSEQETVEVPVVEEPIVEEPIVEEPIDNLIAPPTPGPFYIITLNELVSSQEVLLKKEANDKIIADTIDNPNVVELRAKLLQWATLGFPDAFAVFSVTVTPPPVCSDGVTRSLYDYIQFCSGVSIADKLTSLQSKLQGIQVLNSYSGNTITIHVSK
jgi:hypothetical protein